jgi:hypothetical protein
MPSNSYSKKLFDEKKLLLVFNKEDRRMNLFDSC